MISRKCLGFDDYYNQQAEETVGKYKQGRSFRAEDRTDPPIQADNSQGGQEDQECRRVRAADGFPGRQYDSRRIEYVTPDVTVDDDGEITAHSKLCPAGDVTPEAFSEILEPLEKQVAAFIDTPLGRMDAALLPGEPLERALNGSLIANFFNQVQLEASGADLSCTSLANTLRGFSENVTVRDVVASYVFPNTLKTIRVNRAILTKALERSADYFAFDENGALTVSESFLRPIVQHYNYDFIAGVEATIDLRRAPGGRVTSIRWKGRELPEGQSLTLCMNNYRASGAGGYEFYKDCETVREQTEEISELIIDYIDRHRDITVDKTKWLTILY